MPFTFTPLEIRGVILIEPRVFGDSRGFFLETYKVSDFSSAGIEERFVQENHSRSKRGILRGLHYQVEPHPQGKLVRAVVGDIFDVAVDLDETSPTFGKWIGVHLSAENRRMLYLPPKCAHGFCVTTEVAEVLYKTTSEYSPALERGIAWNDPYLAIQWPVENPELSERDTKWPAFHVPAETEV
jgi:dTDP-4-dehydrorhamnose 3,5-epimerase